MKKIRITAAIFFICLGFFILWKSNLFQGDSSGNSNENQPTFSKYYNGNYKDAYNKLLPAAEKGNVIAQVSLGNLYAAGLGVKQSYKDAYYWYKKAADRGNSDALGSLALMYQYGEYVERNYKKAVELSQKAIKIGNSPVAKYNLAFNYLEGQGVNKDYSMGVKLLAESANDGYSSALSELGVSYYTGNYGLSIDYTKAVELLKKASEKGNPRGQNNLAFIYYEGKATEKNDFEAYKWFYIASEYGHNSKSKELMKAYKFNLTDTQKQQAINEAQQWIKTHKEINLNLVGVK